MVSLLVAMSIGILFPSGLKAPVDPGDAVPVEPTAVAVVGAEGCAHCHQEENPWTHEIVRQMTTDEPKWSVCSGSAGHPVHNCDRDDAFDWFPGACHPPCLEEGLALVLSRNERLTPTQAAELQATHPKSVTFNCSTGQLSIRSCSDLIQIRTI